jgi:hypothetical protein
MIEATFDPKTALSPDAVEKQLGTRAGLWHELVRQIEAMGARGQWVWGGPKYGWEWKAKRAGKPFATLTPKTGVFVVLVILGRTEAAAAAAITLAPRLRRTYESARQFPDGRWLFHETEPKEEVADLVALLRLKLPPTVRARLDGAAR